MFTEERHENIYIPMDSLHAPFKNKIHEHDTLPSERLKSVLHQESMKPEPDYFLKDEEALKFL